MQNYTDIVRQGNHTVEGLRAAIYNAILDKLNFGNGARYGLSRAVMLILVLVLKDSLGTNFKSLSLFLSLWIWSLSL